MLIAALDLLTFVQGIDLAVMIIGALCAVAFLVQLIRRGEWRNPLAGVRAAALWRTTEPAEPTNPEDAARGRPATRLLGPEGPTLLQVAIALVAYMVALQLLAAAFLIGQDVQAATQPGTHAWFLFQAADASTKLLVSLVVIFILARHPLFPPQVTGRAIARKTGLGLLSWLILVPVTLLQLHMGSIIWQWLNPGQILPIHPVLLALKESTVGQWGPAVLFVSAILAAPIAEELLFRGLVLGAVWRLTGRAWVAVVVSGVAFGAIHGQPQDILPLCTMGIILGFVRLRARSLVPPIIAHGLFNARTMAMALLFPEAIGG